MANETCYCRHNNISVNFYTLHSKAEYNRYYTDISAREIEESIGRAYRDFYMRFGYIIKMLLSVRSIEQLFNLIRSGFSVLRFAISKKWR